MEVRWWVCLTSDVADTGHRISDVAHTVPEVRELLPGSTRVKNFLPAATHFVWACLVEASDLEERAMLLGPSSNIS